MSSIHARDVSVFTVGVALDGAGWHPAAWREADARSGELFGAPYWQALVAEAEAAGIDYVTIDDALHLRSHSPFERHIPPRPQPGVVEGRLDALLIASWVAAHTERIGVIPTVTTTHTEPFHVATGLQTLDHISLGRAGWQLRFSASAADAAAFGPRPAPEIDLDAVLAGREDDGLNAVLADAADVAEAARRLWDSWEDDAIIRDVPTGRFLDADRLHHIDFEGERFRVAGPSIVPRSPQGQLPVTLLAHSPQIFGLAARSADVVFITPENESAGAGASRGKTVPQLIAEVRAAEAARDRAATGLAPLRVVADLVVALDTPAEPARERLRRLDESLAAPYAGDARIVAGSAGEIAELIERWGAEGIDGVRLRPLALPQDLAAIGRELLPLLRERGLAEAANNGGRPLRERFGLAPAVNRYTVEREKETVA